MHCNNLELPIGKRSFCNGSGRGSCSAKTHHPYLCLSLNPKLLEGKSSCSQNGQESFRLPKRHTS